MCSAHLCPRKERRRRRRPEELIPYPTHQHPPRLVSGWKSSSTETYHWSYSQYPRERRRKNFQHQLTRETRLASCPGPICDPSHPGETPLPPMHKRWHPLSCLPEGISTVLSHRVQRHTGQQTACLTASLSLRPLPVSRGTLKCFPLCGRKARATPAGLRRGSASSGFLLPRLQVPE